MRRARESYERRTAILVGIVMILSVYLRHKGHDEGITSRSSSWCVFVMNEGKEMGVVDLFVGGDFNMEFELEGCGGELVGIDSVGWYGLYGP